MKLKSVIDSPCGVRYCFESLALVSGYSRYRLLDKEMMSEREEIIETYAHLSSYLDFVRNKDNRPLVSEIQCKLRELKNIGLTIYRLGQGDTLDDIELFEIKHLAMLSKQLRILLQPLKIPFTVSAQSDRVIEILDPDNLEISSFYIYDSYSSELAQLRRKLNAIGEDDMLLMEHCMEIESQIRTGLSRSLAGFSKILFQNMENIADLDIMLAKALQVVELNLAIPVISQGRGSIFESLFNPYIDSLLKKEGKEFQHINISYAEVPILIIGANMGGKTVVLKSLALCQYLLMFGFGIPAKRAEIAIKKELFFVCGDGQNEQKGISSFAAEMKSIDRILRSQENGSDILALIDEPAKSTNPIEGTALVSSLISLLKRKGVSLVMTTHYNIDSEDCKRLKVRGLSDGKMDYTLTPSPHGEVPHEALNVAESLNISQEWLSEARQLLSNTNINHKNAK